MRNLWDDFVVTGFLIMCALMTWYVASGPKMRLRLSVLRVPLIGRLGCFLLVVIVEYDMTVSNSAVTWLPTLGS